MSESLPVLFGVTVCLFVGLFIFSHFTSSALLGGGDPLKSPQGTRRNCSFCLSVSCLRTRGGLLLCFEEDEEEKKENVIVCLDFKQEIH
jgi:hypothetical protein